MDKLFFVEHHITDEAAWAGFMQKWMDILGDEDMTVDKGMQYPEWEGNCPVLKCSDVTGKMTIGLWKTTYATKQEFQEFMDRFTCGASRNKVYAVEGTIGGGKLDPREFMRDFVHAAQGKDRPGYVDKEAFWMTRHGIINQKDWESKINEDLAAKVRKECTTPSDTIKLFPKGHGTSLVIFLSDDTCMCFDGCSAEKSKQEYQEFIDKFTQVTAINTVYRMDPKECVNLGGISEDTWNQDFLKWGNEYVNPFTKTASHETTPVEPQDIHLTSQ